MDQDLVLNWASKNEKEPSHWNLGKSRVEPKAARE